VVTNIIYRASNHSGLIFALHWANSIVLKRAQMKVIEWWQQAGARTAWLSSDLRAELSGDTEVSIDALAPDLREIASALLLCQKTDYSHALERLNGHVFTDEFNGLASLLKARVYAQAGDFKNAGVELENAKNLSADPRIVAEVELLLSQDLDLADDVLENGGLCECEEWQRVLGDTCSFLPRDIQSQIRDKISTVSWLTDGGIVAILCIVLDMKQREYPSALKLIEETYPQSSSKGHLFLLRARVHHALDEFDEMLLCLKGAAELCDDVDMFQGVLDELSSNMMDRPEARQADGTQKCVVSPPNTSGTLDKSANYKRSHSLLKKHKNGSSQGSAQFPDSRDSKDAVATLFCAVYHRDENRYALIEEHLENIKLQSLPVEPIYVFEAGDQPSSAAKPYAIVSPSRLSIYQAWYMAMEHSNKKLLINLNLDDRLCPDAVARMSSYFDSDDVMLVGGEWVIANQIAKSDQLRNISIRETYFDPAWPPKTCSFTRSGEKLRLGSGTGERGTYGPATMFRRSLLEELPYPLKFGNGDLVESIADSLWWSLIKRKYPGGAIRIPEVVGIYHSDPSSQAEFRVTNEWEKLQKWGLM
jgi:tetratricopeptide (TPR) repeat protein